MRAAAEVFCLQGVPAEVPAAQEVFVVRIPEFPAVPETFAEVQAAVAAPVLQAASAAAAVEMPAVQEESVEQVPAVWMVSGFQVPVV